MQPRLRRAVAAVLAAVLAAPSAHAAAPAVAPPPTRVAVVRDTLHGTVIEDPYRWLEDKDAPETREWLDRQIAYTHQALAGWPGREALRARYQQLLKVDLVDVPVERGGRLFFTRRRADQELNVLMVRRGADGPDEVLLDPHGLSPDRSISASYLDCGPDGGLVAVGLRVGGADEVEVAFYDVATRAALPDRLPRARYFRLAVEPGRRGVYYAKYLPEGPRVFHHVLGTEPAQDRLVFGAGRPPGQIITLDLGGDGRWLVMSVLHGSSGSRVEVWAQDLGAGTPPFAVVDDAEANFSARLGGDALYLRTNWQAPDGRIVRVDLRDPSRERWTTVVPEGRGVIEGFALAGGRLFVNVLEDAIPRLRVFDAGGRAVDSIAFPVPGSIGVVQGRWESDEAYLSYSSFAVPTTIHRLRVSSGARTRWWRSPVPVRSDDFETRQVWFTSKDGTRVPMFLVHRRGLSMDGRRPVYLTGYGGFTQNMKPRFTADAVLWAESGGVYALPNLRGGAEFGEPWHRAGMLEHKQNVFDDFIAAAEHLVRTGVTAPERLAISGGSNGGLLVGAAMTQRPELFRAVVCSVPLLDMVRYHRFLVARFWVPEYGSADDPAQFGFIHAYSPYHHVRPGTRYPAVMFVSGDSDTRVDPLHARKMAALMQAATGSDPAERPVLLHYDTRAGHAGGKPVSRQIEDDADEMQFLFAQLGMKPPGRGATGR